VPGDLRWSATTTCRWQPGRARRWRSTRSPVSWLPPI